MDQHPPSEADLVKSLKSTIQLMIDENAASDDPIVQRLSHANQIELDSIEELDDLIHLMGGLGWEIGSILRFLFMAIGYADSEFLDRLETVGDD